MRNAVAAALLASTMLAGQVEAWTVTAKGAVVSSGSANAVIASQTYTVGSIVWLFGMSRGSTSSDNLTLTGSLTGAIPVDQIQVCATGGSANKLFQAWVYAAGGSETWTLNNSAGAVTSLSVRSAQIDGAAATSTEDLGARNCNTGQGLNPNITTSGGSLAESGELAVSVVGRIGSSLGYTEDPAWVQIGGEGGNTNLRDAGGYKEAPSISPVTHSVTVTQSNSNIAIMTFRAASAPPPIAPRMGPLLGVQN